MIDKSKLAQAAQTLLGANNEENWATYIAAANPAAILELLAELDSRIDPSDSVALSNVQISPGIPLGHELMRLHNYDKAAIGGSSPADAGGLTRYRLSGGADAEMVAAPSGDYFKAVEVGALLATKAAQPAPATRDQIIEASGNALLAGEKPGSIDYDVALVRNIETMRGISPAPSAKQEPVAIYSGVEFSRYTIEWTSGPVPVGTKFFAAPSASASPAAPWADLVRRANDVVEGLSGMDNLPGAMPQRAFKLRRALEAVESLASPAAAVAAPIHDSDCSLHNEPAYPVGPCDCSVDVPVAGSQQVPDNQAKATHEQALAGYAVACKFGVYEARAFKMVDEMFAALAATAPAVPVPAEQKPSSRASVFPDSFGEQGKEGSAS